jgi:F0F1-type ATP synthase assembly protein I
MARSPEADRQWRLAGRFSAVGIEMAAAVAMGAIGGRWLDQRFDTEPYLLWLGLVVGIGAAVRAVVRVVKAYRRM